MVAVDEECATGPRLALTMRAGRAHGREMHTAYNYTLGAIIGISILGIGLAIMVW